MRVAILQLAVFQSSKNYHKPEFFQRFPNFSEKACIAVSYKKHDCSTISKSKRSGSKITSFIRGQIPSDEGRVRSSTAVQTMFAMGDASGFGRTWFCSQKWKAESRGTLLICHKATASWPINFTISISQHQLHKFNVQRRFRNFNFTVIISKLHFHNLVVGKMRSKSKVTLCFTGACHRQHYFSKGQEAWEMHGICLWVHRQQYFSKGRKLERCMELLCVCVCVCFCWIP